MKKIALMLMCVSMTLSARPKLALVLSGGGPRGGAQIGVLKVLREMRIPVDFIVGCSIGSYVGGFYAAGMTPEEVEATMREIDFKGIFRDLPPRTELPFRLKQKDFNYLTGLNLGIGKGGLRSRRGISSGRRARYAFKRYLAAMQDLKSFDDLPVPFRAAASDLTHGRAAYLEGGDLSSAIMASMSFPGMIFPRDISGTTFVDGWVTRNLPIDAAKKAGAEALVVVDISSQFQQKNEFGSLLDVTLRLLDMVTEEATAGQRAMLGPLDVKITPEMENFSGMDYDRLDEALKIGEDAARKAAPQLKRYSVSEKEYAAWERKRRTYAAPKIKISAIRIKRADMMNEFVLARMHVKPGEILDFKIFENDLEVLMDSGLYEDVDYSLVPTGSGAYELLIDPIEKNWGPNYLNVGLKLVSDFEGHSDFEIGVDYTQTKLSDSGLELRHMFYVGRVNLYDAEFYQPIFNSPFFIAPGLEAGSRVQNVEKGDGSSIPGSTSWGVGRGDLGLKLGDSGEFRAGWRAGKMWAGVLGGLNAEIPMGGPRLQLNIDTLDQAHFPGKGVYLRALYDEARVGLDGAPVYRVLRATGDEAFSLGKHSVVLGFDGTSSMGTGLPFFESPSLGGFLRLSGYHEGQLRGNEAFLGRLVYYYQIRQPLAIFGDRVCPGFSVEAGDVWASNIPARLSGLKSSASLFFCLNTALGPVYLAHGRNSEGGGVTYFYLGNPF